MNADEFKLLVKNARKSMIHTNSKNVEMALATGIIELLRRLEKLEKSVEYLVEKEGLK